MTMHVAQAIISFASYARVILSFLYVFIFDVIASCMTSEDSMEIYCPLMCRLSNVVVGLFHQLDKLPYNSTCYLRLLSIMRDIVMAISSQDSTSADTCLLFSWVHSGKSSVDLVLPVSNKGKEADRWCQV